MRRDQAVVDVDPVARCARPAPPDRRRSAPSRARERDKEEERGRWGSFLQSGAREIGSHASLRGRARPRIYFCGMTAAV